jgi:hypothetical protein
MIVARELLRATDPDYMKRLSRQDMVELAFAMSDAPDVNGVTIAAAKRSKDL